MVFKDKDVYKWQQIHFPVQGIELVIECLIGCADVRVVAVRQVQHLHPNLKLNEIANLPRRHLLVP